MPFSTTIIQGKGGTFRLSDPRPMLSIGMLDVDDLVDSWFSDCFPNPILTEGKQHPLFPGMVLYKADFDEIAPAWPATPELPAGVPGDYRVQCHWLGDSRGTTPTKFISRSATRTIGIGFDQFNERYISWNAHPMPITGTASTKLINHPGNTFSNGDRIAFPSLTGGSGITGGSTTALPVVYFVINRTADNYQLSLTLGGSAVDPVTNITGGYVIDARFCVGCVHPIWSGMLVAAATPTDNGTAWRTVDVSFMGRQFDKPFHRVITCAGQQMSSSDKIIWDFPDGWTTALYSSVQMPEIGVVDTFLTIASLDTNLVPGSTSEVGTPSNAPSIKSVFVFGDDDHIVHDWPNGWSLLDESDVETINSQSGVRIKRSAWRYIWPISLK